MKKYIFLLISLLIIPIFTYADNFPDFPMAFWGNTTLNSQPMASGTKIVAYCNSDIIGQTTMSENGIYGYNDSIKNKLLVKQCVTPIIFKYIPVGQTISVTGDSAISYSQGFISGSTVNKDLNFVNDTTYPNDTGIVTINNTTPQVIISNPTQATTITINSGTINPQIDVSSFITNGTGTLPAITITSANANNANVAIFASTTVTSADITWNGIIAAPTVTNITVPNTATETMTTGTAIEVGFTRAKLSFNKAVRILLPGQAGKRAGYVRTGINFTEITAICATDNQAIGDGLSVDGDCKINTANGLDLVIWTKHFTSFASFTATTNTVSSGSGGGEGGGGGASITYNNPPTPPAGGYVFKINNGALSTNNLSVTLTINGGIEATKMAIANGEEFSTTSQEVYTTTKAWALTSGEGIKKVCIKFYGSSGYASSNICTQINLETNSTIGTNNNTVTAPVQIVTTTVTMSIDQLIAITQYKEKSENVKNLQIELKKAGFFPIETDTTGYYGDATVKAVKSYQSSKNTVILTTSSNTIDQLISSTKYKERSNNVTKLQNELKALGFLSKDIDSTGYYGEKTLEAVKKYQDSLKTSEQPLVSKTNTINTGANQISMDSLGQLSRADLLSILMGLIQSLISQGKLKL
jgi:peptidoglycan hydrolase-like protein with peptidoglycan-binding domain